jgi:hypothetical protein
MTDRSASSPGAALAMSKTCEPGKRLPATCASCIPGGHAHSPVLRRRQLLRNDVWGGRCTSSGRSRSETKTVSICCQEVHTGGDGVGSGVGSVSVAVGEGHGVGVVSVVGGTRVAADDGVSVGISVGAAVPTARNPVGVQAASSSTHATRGNASTPTMPLRLNDCFILTWTRAGAGSVRDSNENQTDYTPAQGLGR